jgi:hypothetical protein
MSTLKLGFRIDPREKLDPDKGHFRDPEKVNIAAVLEKLIDPIMPDKGGRRVLVGLITSGGRFEPLEEQPKQIGRYQHVYLPGFGVFKNSGGSKKKLQALSIKLDSITKVTVGQLDVPSFQKSLSVVVDGSFDARVRFRAASSMTLEMDYGADSISIIMDTTLDLTTWMTAFMQGNLIDQDALPF